MYEIIVRLSRAIASHPRLRILTYLAQHGETTPTGLQASLRLPLNAVSQHLRTLASVGLISGRRSGARCYYDFRSPYPKNTLSGDMSCWLRGVLRKADVTATTARREVPDRPAPDGQADLHKVIFNAATAFTDLRRLQILEHVATHKRATAETLGAQLKMSAFAVSRQTAKLRRRGVLTAQRPVTSGLLYEFAPQPKTAIHGQMLAIIRTTLKKRELRTS